VVNQHSHRLRGIRGIPDETWERYDEAVKRAGTDKSSAVAAFIRWYIHESELPERPAP
jgi:hypothetical protein